MFFRRGRLRAKKAQALLVEQFNQRYQWSLRIPIVHFLARGDPLRFLCSLRFLVDQVGQGVYLLNRRQPLTVIGHRVNQVPNQLPLHEAVGLRDVDPDHPDRLLETELQVPDIATKTDISGEIEAWIDRVQLDDIVLTYCVGRLNVRLDRLHDPGREPAWSPPDL